MIGDPMTFSILVVIIGIPVYQCVLLTRIHKYLPNMLKRMGFDLVLSLIKEIADLIIMVTANSDCVVENREMPYCFLMYSEIQVNGTCVGYMDVYNTTACDMVTNYHFPNSSGSSSLSCYMVCLFCWYL